MIVFQQPKQDSDFRHCWNYSEYAQHREALEGELASRCILQEYSNVCGIEARVCRVSPSVDAVHIPPLDVSHERGMIVRGEGY